jgi:predicted amidohydrolase
MTIMKVAAIQMRSGTSPERNAVEMERLVREAVALGAAYVQTPEMTGAIVRDPKARAEIFTSEDKDVVVATARRLARELGIFLHIGSTAIVRADGKLANKIHMFDVDLDGGESWRESSAYEPGTQATVVDLPGVRLGLAICYDLRFPQLFRAEALAGAEVLSVPAAFTRQTGEAHWHVLLRARAIENGAFVVAAAQGGRHEDGRETFGHSIIVDPWGRILAEAGHDEPGVITATIDTAEVEAARRKIPNLKNAREFAVASAGGEKIRGAAS